jgi:hypothetical protein
MRGPALYFGPAGRELLTSAFVTGLVGFFVAIEAFVPVTDRSHRHPTAHPFALVAVAILGLLAAVGYAFWVARSGVKADGRGVELRRLGSRRRIVWAEVMSMDVSQVQHPTRWPTRFNRSASALVGVLLLRDGEWLRLPGFTCRAHDETSFLGAKSTEIKVRALRRFAEAQGASLSAMGAAASLGKSRVGSDLVLGFGALAVWIGLSWASRGGIDLSALVFIVIALGASTQSP